MTKLTQEDMLEMSRQGQQTPNYRDLVGMLGAVWDGNIGVIQNFIDINGAEFIDACTSSEETALQKAAGLRSVAVFDFLLDNGADIEARNSVGHTVLMNEVCMKIKESGNNFLKRIITAGADLEARDNNGRTAFHYAVEGNDPNSVSVLIEHGADIYAVDKNGRDAKALARVVPNDYTEVLNLIEARHQVLHHDKVMAEVADAALRVKEGLKEPLVVTRPHLVKKMRGPGA